MKLYLKKQTNSGTNSTSAGAPGTATAQNATISAKSSPSMNLIQTTYQFYNQHKIPLSTDNQQALHKFEFPLSKGNSGNSEDDFDTNNLYVSDSLPLTTFRD